jgi:putative spermidine/putrescine transport system substrate-binding protein
VLLCVLVACGSGPPINDDPAKLNWSEIELAARNRQITFAMWMGDPFINDYMRDFVAVEVKRLHGIEIKFVPAQGGQIVSALLVEKEAGQSASAFDMVWINGETFYQLRQINALYGPFVEKLPNAQYIDLENPFIGIDFQYPIDGYECPWGNVQLALIYNSERVPEPPKSREALLTWAEANPGRFTWDTEFTGMTLLKSWLIDVAGGQDALSGPFDEAKYAQYSAKLWEYIRQLQPFLWRQGKSFPSNVAQMHQMYANGELDFTMSNNDREVDNKVLQGVFPDTSRAFAFAGGTIQNSHYLGIPSGSLNKEAALTVINFMISPEAQLKKMDPRVWGDGTVLDLDKLPPETAARFKELESRMHAPPRAELEKVALMELAPEYMIRISKDFRKEILGE